MVSGMKKGFLIFICIAAGFAGLVYLIVHKAPTSPESSSRKTPESKEFSSDLVVRGDRLLLEQTDWINKGGNEPVTATMEITKGKPLTYNAVLDHSENLTIQGAPGSPTLKGKSVVSVTPPSGSHSIYYLHNQSHGSHYYLGRWTPSEGFKTIFRFSSPVSYVLQSFDGDAVAVVEETGKLAVINSAGVLIKRFFLPDRTYNHFMIGPDSFLVSTYAETRVWHPSTGKFEHDALDGDFLQLIAYEGNVWAVRYLHKEFTVVRLSKSLDKIEEELTLPRDFNIGTRFLHEG